MPRTALEFPRESLSGAPLIEALRAGRPDALAALYVQQRGALLRLLTGILGAQADAEDVLHDLFVGLPEALQRYAPRGSFDAWLHKVAVRTALMHLRSARRRAHLALEDAPTLRASRETDRLATAREAFSAVLALDEPQRTVFVLFHIEGFSHREIAGLLGISTITSRVRLSRAVARLRQTIVL